MKKLLKLSLFVTILLLGTQNTLGQDEETNPEVIAKEKTYRLTQEFGLDSNQQSLVWRAFMAREKAKIEAKNSSYSEKEIKQVYLKVDENFQNSMQNYLNVDQYAKFKLIMKDYL